MNSRCFRFLALLLMPPVFHVVSESLRVAELNASTRAVVLSGLLLLVTVWICIEDAYSDIAIDLPRLMFAVGTFLALQYSFGTLPGLMLKFQRDLWAEVAFCAFCEELAFRRLILTKIRTRLTGSGVQAEVAVPLAAISCSTLFASLHQSGSGFNSEGVLASFIQHFLAGMTFWVAAEIGGLATAVSLHTSSNIHVYSGVSTGIFDVIPPRSLAGSVTVLVLVSVVRWKHAGHVREFART